MHYHITGSLQVCYVCVSFQLATYQGYLLATTSVHVKHTFLKLFKVLPGLKIVLYEFKDPLTMTMKWP